MRSCRTAERPADSFPPFPPAAQQREQKPKAVRFDRAAVVFELPYIAFALAVEERFPVGAFVPAGLEIDHPAMAFGVEKHAIDDQARESAIGEHTHAMLAASLRMRTEHPPATLVR